MLVKHLVNSPDLEQQPLVLLPSEFSKLLKDPLEGLPRNLLTDRTKKELFGSLCWFLGHPIHCPMDPEWTHDSLPCCPVSVCALKHSCANQLTHISGSSGRLILWRKNHGTRSVQRLHFVIWWQLATTNSCGQHGFSKDQELVEVIWLIGRPISLLKYLVDQYFYIRRCVKVKGGPKPFQIVQVKKFYPPILRYVHISPWTTSISVSGPEWKGRLASSGPARMVVWPITTTDWSCPKPRRVFWHDLQHFDMARGFFTTDELDIF